MYIDEDSLTKHKCSNDHVTHLRDAVVSMKLKPSTYKITLFRSEANKSEMKDQAFYYNYYFYPKLYGHYPWNALNFIKTMQKRLNLNNANVINLGWLNINESNPNDISHIIRKQDCDNVSLVDLTISKSETKTPVVIANEIVRTTCLTLTDLRPNGSVLTSKWHANLTETNTLTVVRSFPIFINNGVMVLCSLFRVESDPLRQFWILNVKMPVVPSAKFGVVNWLYENATSVCSTVECNGLKPLIFMFISDDPNCVLESDEQKLMILLLSNWNLLSEEATPTFRGNCDQRIITVTDTDTTMTSNRTLDRIFVNKGMEKRFRKVGDVRAIETDETQHFFMKLGVEII